jgi:Mg2+ and Co2+ transporter CorA
VAAEWTDLVDPGRDEFLHVLGIPLDPETIEILAEPAGDGRSIRPRCEGHGGYVLAVLSYAMARRDGRAAYLELDLVATPTAVLTIRKTGSEGMLAPIDGTAARVEAGAEPAALFQGAVDDAADAFLERVDGLYEAIDDLESDLDHMPGHDVRRRIAVLRNELLHARRASTATRGVARRVVDGRLEIGHSELFPADSEARFVDTYETLVRVTEELDVARDLLGSVRDYCQAKIAEQQNEVGKKLTVIASLVLVPSFIVGFYGQNFAGEFRAWFWGFGVSLGLILATTVVQLALFRWRRWI